MRGETRPAPRSRSRAPTRAEPMATRRRQPDERRAGRVESTRPADRRDARAGDAASTIAMTSFARRRARHGPRSRAAGAPDEPRNRRRWDRRRERRRRSPRPRRSTTGRRPRSCSSRASPTKGPTPAIREVVARRCSSRCATSGSRPSCRRRSAGPHVSRYELQLAPGHQGLEDHPAQGRPRLRAGLDRHPHPGADPGQEGGRGRGAEPAPPPGPPRRHLRRAARRGPRRWSPGSARTSPGRPSGPTWR